MMEGTQGLQDNWSEESESQRSEAEGGGNAAGVSRYVVGNDQEDSVIMDGPNADCMKGQSAVSGSGDVMSDSDNRDSGTGLSDVSVSEDGIIDDETSACLKEGFEAAVEKGYGDRHDSEGEKVGEADPVEKTLEESLEPCDDDEEELVDTGRLSAEERNALFASGLTQEKQGKKGAALKCYLGCLSGLTKDTRFVLLPQCLRNIAEIYYQNQDYDKAIHFVQAEKLYYENALINTEEIQQKLEELNMSQPKQPSDGSGDADPGAVETMRAEEYEHLARLCRDKQQPQLAMEYAGKCTRLRQQVLGEHHPKTQETLDFFASLYAEVGKQQYNDCLQTLDSGEGVAVSTDSESSVPTTPSGDCSPVSILRHRKNSEKDKKHVRFHESVVDNSNQREQEEWLSRTVVGILLVMCCIFLTILGLGLYCRVLDARPCRTLMEGAHNTYLHMRYQYYKYTSTKHVKFA